MAQRRTASPNVDIERAHRKERAHRRGVARANEGDGGPARSSDTPPSLKPAVLARRQAASRAVRLRASLARLRTILPGARASDAKGFEGHVRGPAGLGSVCAQAVVVLLVLNGAGTLSADAATVWVVSKYEFPQPLKMWATIFRCLGVPTGITACPMGAWPQGGLVSAVVL